MARRARAFFLLHETTGGVMSPDPMAAMKAPASVRVHSKGSAGEAERVGSGLAPRIHGGASSDTPLPAAAAHHGIGWAQRLTASLMVLTRHCARAVRSSGWLITLW